MRKRPVFSAVCLCLFLGLMFPAAVSANSSWHWISAQRPYDLLPLVAAVTLAAETFAVDHFGRVKRFPKTVWVIILANLLSFSAPYLLTYLANAPIYTFAQAVEHLPLFTVGFWYLLLTLGVEGPVVYFCLRRDVREQERLLAVIGLSNLVTTLFVALVERTLCHGSW